MLLTNLIRTSVAALGALAVVSVTQANAADIYAPAGGYKDIPVAPCCSFAGFYVGGSMGMAWTEHDLDNQRFNDAIWQGRDQYGNPIWGQHSGNFSNQNNHSTSGFGGGQFGYNFQNSCCWLYGIEVDLGAIGLNNRNHRVLHMDDKSVVAVSLDGRNNDDAVFAGDVTGRLGYTFGNSLVYVKGGFAFIDNNNNGLSETIFWNPKFAWWNGLPGSSTFNSNGNNDNWLTGWTVGAGYEWKPCCQSNWSIKVEYLHYDFSNNNNDCCRDFFVQKWDLNNRFRNDRDLTADTVKIGFNYFLNPAPVVAPLK